MAASQQDGDSTPKVNHGNWKSIGELAKKLVERHG